MTSLRTVGLGIAYDELQVGDQFRTLARTLTETDLVNFINTTGMVEVLFTDVEYAKTHAPQGGRLVPGALVYAVAEGLLVQATLQRTGLAFLSMNFEILKPTFVGDTVHVEVEVLECRATSKTPDRGLVRTRNNIVNQHEEVVISYAPLRMAASTKLRDRDAQGNILNRRYRSVFRQDLFDGQRILVTGGGSGIGRCIAHELASVGATVLIVGRTAAKLESVVDEIEQDGGEAEFLVCDVRDEEMVESVINQFVLSAPVDGLVNCAGGQFPALLEEMSVKGFEAVVRNNLTSAFVVSKILYEACLRRRGGVIVNITADHVGGMPLMGHSGAARAGVENLTATAALEWAENGVRVNAVAPGYIESSGFDTYTDERMIAALKSFAKRTPLGRLGCEAEVSAAVCFLLSEAAAFITGQVWRVDGGFGLNTNTPMLERSDPKSQVAFNGFHRSVRPSVTFQS